MAGNHHKVKRLKLNCQIVYPDSKVKISKTELFKSSTSVSANNRPLQLADDVTIQDTITTEPHPSQYINRLEDEYAAWESSTPKLIGAYYDSCVPRKDEVCLECQKTIDLTEGHIRCQDCAAHAYFCLGECARMKHSSKQLPFHKPDIWKVINNDHSIVCFVVYIRFSHSIFQILGVELSNVYPFLNFGNASIYFYYNINIIRSVPSASHPFAV